MKLPRDFASHNMFRRLVELIGDETVATLLLVKLWVELSYQVEMHGRSGYFQKTERSIFIASLKSEAGEDCFQNLIISGLIEESKEPNAWVCKLFRRHNPEMDADYAMGQKRKAIIGRDAVRMTESIIANLPPEMWDDGAGTRMSPAEMNRCIMLVKTIDGIIGVYPARTASGFEVGMMHDAIRIVRSVSDKQLQAVCLMIYDARKKGALRDVMIPNNTAVILREFKDIAASVIPTELKGLIDA